MTHSGRSPIEGKHQDMDAPAARFSVLSGIALRITVGLMVCLQTSNAHDLFEQWGADVTPILCAMASASGWEYDEEYDTKDHGPVNVRVYIGSFHPGVESTLDHLEELEPEPFFINLQAITSFQIRTDDVSVSNVTVQLGEDSVQPIADATWEHDSLPVVYLGGEEAIRFVEMLDRKEAPVVSVTLSDSSSYDVQITTNGFHIARAMMTACVQSVKEFPVE